MNDPTALTPEVLEQMEALIPQRPKLPNEFQRLIDYHREHPEVPVRLWASEFTPNPDSIIMIWPNKYIYDLVVTLICHPQHAVLVCMIFPFVKMGVPMEPLPKNPEFELQYGRKK